jgi:hypothetical protein
VSESGRELGECLKAPEGGATAGASFAPPPSRSPRRDDDDLKSYTHKNAEPLS